MRNEAPNQIAALLLAQIDGDVRLVAQDGRGVEGLAVDLRTGSPATSSTLTTSAPKSASRRAQNGPATVEPRSRTR
jgi:hypothetical protein